MRIPNDSRWQATGETAGEGGQGQVYLVTDKKGEFEGTWALKALKRAQPGQAYERFCREVEAIKKLEHPNIIRIIDHSPPNADFHYYVMEYLADARPLEKLITSEYNPFCGNALASLVLFEQICLALAKCESPGVGIVHRDLSPANILVRKDLSIRIIDFGLCQIQGHETITLVDEGVGTINYMSPECESGSNERIGIGADLYSAGKILWSAITGLRAFSRENPAFNGKTMREMFPEDPSTWHLHHIFEKTIRRDWRNRWGSARDAVSVAKRVAYLIRSGYPPLEDITTTCPVCGVGEILGFPSSHMVFGNPNPEGVGSYQCSYCGLCFAINYAGRNKRLKERRELE